jgi:MFS family permease
MSAQPSSLAVTGQILSIVIYTFIGFVSIGIPIAVVPSYVHDDLAFSAVIAGLVIGVQYLATLLSRPLAGRLADSLGAKKATIYGLLGILSSGALTLLATSLQQLPLLSLLILVAARIVLGVTQGVIGVSVISWGIRDLGNEHTARVISWNGIAAYGGIALGAPVGVLLVKALGLWSMGSSLMLLACLGLLLVWRKAAPALVPGERLAFRTVLRRMLPYGTGLALASIGYGTLTTFVTLYYNSLDWEGAAYCLTAFGMAFIAARLLFVNAIGRIGGFRVAIACMGIETLGFVLLWFAPTPVIAMCGAALAGFGLSLVYPALGIEALNAIPASSRGAALGAYGLFFDLALGLAGPVMGAVASGYGYPAIFLCAAFLALAGVVLSAVLARRAQQPDPA